MAYKNTLKNYLKTEKIDKNGKKRTYELSYEFRGYKRYFFNLKEYEIIEKDPQFLSINETFEYIQRNYVNKDCIEKRKLLNDLVVFKTYKDKIELEMEDFQFLISILAICATIFCAILNGISTQGIIFFGKTVSYLIIFAFYIMMLYFIDRIPKKTKFNKLKSVNNVIYVLEAIKEEIVEFSDDRVFQLEVINPENKSATNIYSVKVKES